MVTALNESVDLVTSFLRTHGDVVVLTGAGCSTESGIPDYRGPEGSLRNHRPVHYSEFVRSAAARQRYWARSFAGWEKFSSAQPNDGHRALAGLEAAGFVKSLITQNVDRLHHRAGSRDVIELHGRNDLAECLDCHRLVDRVSLHETMREENHDWNVTEADARPDGDSAVTAEMIARFVAPQCARCGGVLKPAVVFFGESIPKDVVDAASRAIRSADAVLVIGTTLTTWSSYRLVVEAAERRLAVGVVNRGPTRADALVDWKLQVNCATTLAAAASLLV